MEEIKTGNREDLILEWLPFVRSIASRMLNRRFDHIVDDIDDLYQVGVCGLIHAVDNFNDKNGCSFLTYARICIINTIRNHLEKNDYLKRKTRRKTSYIKLIMHDLQNKLQREPFNFEVMEESKCKTTDIILCNIKNIQIDSLLPDNYILKYDYDIELDYIDMERLYILNLAIESIKDNRRYLRQYEIFKLYYFDNLNQVEIAEIYKVTKQRVSQILFWFIMLLRERITLFYLERVN